MKASEAGYDQTAAREPSASSTGARPPELAPLYLPHLERSARLAAEGFPKQS